jgi:hypothetical protein
VGSLVIFASSGARLRARSLAAAVAGASILASHGIRSRCVNLSPCRRHPLRASTPSSVSTAFGQLGSRRANAFRPRGFSPPRRLSPHAESWACCIPLPARVRRVSAPLLPLAARAIREDDLALRPVSLGLSRCALHTPRRSPPECSRVASLRPLPPRRCACARALSEDNIRSPTLDLEALLRVRVRSDHPLLPGDDRPLLPWASFPSRVLTRAARSDPRCLHHGPFRAAPPDFRPHCCVRCPPPPLPPTEAAPVAERRTSRISPTRREDIPSAWFA